MENPTVIETRSSITGNADTHAILSAIQHLQIFVEDQFRRVNERLDQIENAMKSNYK